MKASLSRFLLLILALMPTAAFGEIPADRLWNDTDESLLRDSSERDIVPERYRTLSLELESLDAALAGAPLESSSLEAKAQIQDDLILSLPLPGGDFSRFKVVESPIMEAELAAKFPEIKTYRGQGIDDPSARVRFDRTPAGFHAMILSPSGSVYIDPYRRHDDSTYISYWAHDLRRDHGFTCEVEGHSDPALVTAYRATKASIAGSGDTLRTYRLAVAATGEYTAFHGGTVALGQAAIVTAMNRVNGIYEQEVAIRMVLVANNNLVVYTDGATDPYTNDDGGTMLGENQSNLNSVIGTANYDIGHVFSTGGGGVASLGVPCTGSKARGVTGLGSPIGDPFWVDFVAHEMGHQWSGNHSFNGDAGNCSGGNRNASTAYEPGSGTTIQAYAGICGAQNLQSNSDPFFHGISLDEIIAYSTLGNGNGCAAQTATGNSAPTADAGPAYTVPLQTPFELCGSGLDPNSDPLTFSWEQFDLGPAGAPDAPVDNAPIFRSFSPTASPCRSFPRLADLAAESLPIGQLLPTYARTMNFRLTARDNRSGGGGVGDDSTTVTVSDTAGPFLVTSPNTVDSFGEGSMQTVSWDVANTDQAPISCGTVDILLSTDGGLTYPTMLATGVANNGTNSVTLPDSASFAARIQVRCATSIFFDISDVDFGIGVPLVDIMSPMDGSDTESGADVTFTATATDPEDGNLAASLVWTSSIDGILGGGGTLEISNLSLGIHTITASATDSDVNTATAEITVQVLPACVDLVYSAGFETDEDGWVDGASSCTTGTFIRGTPDEVIAGAVTTQVGGAATGTFAWFTANNTGGAGTDDVDGGTCETLSPVINVGADSVVTALVDFFHGQRDGGDDPADGFALDLINSDTNALIATLASVGDEESNAVWATAWTQQDMSSANVRLRVRVTDGGGDGDLIEAGIDNVRVCTGQPAGLFQDGFESGGVTFWSSTSP